ncbi:MAG: NADH-quinone oxidoreductase subunit NuoK [Actinomycetota bacterium]|jgi:NADH:ubiquinone oxidoreductase subunit K|nr:NADH-quinone oxidoreductase subunit NuoK [Actinomycetota bacterium]
MIGVLVSVAVFCIGVYGVLTRRDIVGVLASIEVMLAGSMLALVAMASGADSVTGVRPLGQSIEAVVLLLMVIDAAEAAVGLALLVSVARRRGVTRIDELQEVKG